MIEYFRRILTDSRNTTKVGDIFYPFYVVLYDKKYIYHEDLQSIGVIISSLDGEVFLCVPANLFLEEVAVLIKMSSNSEEDMISATTAFIENLFRNNEKDTSKFKSFVKIFWLDRSDNHIGSTATLLNTSGDKTDIRIVLHDQRTKMNNDMGFSIKSQLGGDSTLLNASGATNFVYRIKGCTFSDKEIERINAIDTRTKIIDRIAAIERKGGKLVFDKVDNDTFRRNLDMIDLGLGATIAQLLLEQFNTGARMFDELTDALSQSNPLGFDEADAVEVYTFKLKKLLTSTALGMMPSKKWSGKYDANGGYLVVKKDGEILCYHFYDQNRFEDFLFKNAYLERGKTRRHGYASLYRDEDGDVYFKLNLQIRLK